MHTERPAAGLILPPAERDVNLSRDRADDRRIRAFGVSLRKALSWSADVIMPAARLRWLIRLYARASSVLPGPASHDPFHLLAHAQARSRWRRSSRLHFACGRGVRRVVAGTGCSSSRRIGRRDEAIGSGSQRPVPTSPRDLLAIPGRPHRCRLRRRAVLRHRQRVLLFRVDDQGCRLAFPGWLSEPSLASAVATSLPKPRRPWTRTQGAPSSWSGGSGPKTPFYGLEEDLGRR